MQASVKVEINRWEKMRWYSELIPHMDQSSSMMGRKKLLTKKEPLNPLFLKSLSLKNECLGPFSLTLTINYRSYPGDFIWFHAAPERLLGCTLLIKELWGVKHRVGLSSPLQPNQSDSALPHTAPPPTPAPMPLLNTEHIENIFNLPIRRFLCDTQTIKDFCLVMVFIL